MSLSDVVNVSITTQTSGVTRAGFGIPCVFALVVPVGFPVSKSYESPEDMVTDGFSTNNPAYLQVSSVLSQNPRVVRVKVARRSGTLAYSNTMTLGLTTVVPLAGVEFSMSVRSPAGVITAVSEIADGVDDYDDIATTLAALIDAVTDLTASATLNVISVDADNTNELFYFDGMTTNLGYLDTSSGASAELAADFAAAVNFDPDFYGVLLDTQSPADNTAMAAVVEPASRLFGASTTDALCLDVGDSSDIMSVLQASATARTYVIYSADQSSYAAGAWMGDRFPSDPGSSTWKFKTLNGVTADTIDSSEQASVISKGGNTNINIAGRNITCDGTVAEGEYIDIIRFVDWLVARIEEDVFTALANAPKIPFTDAGFDQIRNVLDGRLTNGITVGGLAEEPPFIITMPLAADSTPRTLSGVKFSAPLAGAIHAVNITGVLTV